MAFGIVTAMAFISGMACASIDRWQMWLQLCAVCGLATGLVARWLGAA